MRAWLLEQTGEPRESLHFTTTPEPAPGEGELVVDVEVAGLSFADLLLIRGEYQIDLPLPCSPGSELVGTVCAVGPGTSTPVGTRVLGLARPPDGAYAEQAIVIEQQCEPIPLTLSGAAAVALIGNYVTAHLALHRRAHVAAGEVVVVHGGAGGVGSAAIQIAKAAGAIVIAADLGAERAQGCRELGADVGVDIHTESLADVVRVVSSGRGADVVIDPVGGDLFDAARRFVAYEGRIVVVGFTSGNVPVLRVNQLILRSFTVMGVNALTVLEQYPQLHHEARRAVVDLLAAGSIDPRVGLIVEFEDLITAMDAVGEGRVLGKSVVRVA